MKINIEKIKDNLEKGGILVHGTDTCFGFASFFDNQLGIKRIQEIKGRSESKPFSLLFSSLEQAKDYVYIDNKQENFIKTKAKKSSFILKKKEVLNNYFPKFDSVSVRIENNDFLFKPVSFFGKPITSTSVNISGEKNLNSEKEILDKFGKYDFIDFVFNGELEGVSSEIWDLTGEEFARVR